MTFSKKRINEVEAKGKKFKVADLFTSHYRKPLTLPVAI